MSNPLTPPYIDWFRVPVKALARLLKDSDYADLIGIAPLEDVAITSDDNVFRVSELVVDPNDESKVLYHKLGLYTYIYNKVYGGDKDCG